MSPRALAAWLAVLIAGDTRPQCIEHVGSTPACMTASHAQPRSISGRGFEENKGQVRQTSGDAAPFVRYRLTSGTTSIFLLRCGIAFQFAHVIRPENHVQPGSERFHHGPDAAHLADMETGSRLRTYRMDMTLEDADPHAPVTALGRSSDLTNYHNRGVLGVHTYEEVVFHDVYPNIDWSIRAVGEGIEHDLIVRPGGDPSVIKLRFTHHEELRLDEQGRLVHGNHLGRFIEERPVSYQDGSEVQTSFRLDGDLLSFELGNYDRTRTLRIDPERVWGTYYGGEAEEWAYGLTTDAEGNVYMAGGSTSLGDIATPGAHDEAFDGAYDATLVKFTPDGQRVWGTYFGGALEDAFAACVVHGDVLYAAGSTRSADLGTPGAHQPGLGGDSDGLLVKFDLDGGLSWATCYGGSGFDQGRSCAVDPSGNIYLAGVTDSEEPGVIGQGGHQNSSGGYKESFLVKFNADGQRLWGTYYGGYSDDEAFCCATAANGSVYLAGGTGTEGGAAIATSGGQQPVFGGQADAFLAKFDSTGLRKWGTYYGATGVDYGFTCSTDDADNVYLGGDTYSLYGIAAAGHQNNHGGGGLDAFLVKFDGSGERLWGTYYGGSGPDECRGSGTDEAGNVYLVGQTGSTNGIASYGHQMNFGGGDRDGFLARFTPDGQRMFGTYYGGASYDEAQAITTIGTEQFLCGRTGSSASVSTPDAHATALSGPFDAFLVKFTDTLDCSGVLGGMAYPGSACDDGEPCTLGDAWSIGCSCGGTQLTAGPISGDSLLLDGPSTTYVYNVPTVPGASYAWDLPLGWSAAVLDSSAIEVSAPEGIDTVDLCVSIGIDGCVASACLTVTVLITEVAGTDAVPGARFSIRPNPNNGRFILLGEGRSSGPLECGIVDATGRTLRTSMFTELAANSWDLEDLPSGAYILRIGYAEGVSVLRLIIQ
jgi:hypothetical protein